MAGVIYQDAINVIPSNTINIPQPGIIISGTNTAAPGTILTDVGKGFTNSETNPKGFNIVGGSVVYDSAGAIAEVEKVVDSDNIELLSAIAAGTYEIYNGSYTTANFKSDGFSLYITGAGNLSVVTVFGNTVVIPVLANSFLDLQVIRVNATGTTATGIIALQIQD